MATIATAKPAVLSFSSACHCKSPGIPQSEGLSCLPCYPPATHSEDFCLLLGLSRLKWAHNSKTRIHFPHEYFLSKCLWSSGASRASLLCSLVALLGMVGQETPRASFCRACAKQFPSACLSLAGRSRSLVLVKEQGCHLRQSGEGGRHDPVSACLVFRTLTAFSAQFAQCL